MSGKGSLLNIETYSSKILSCEILKKFSDEAPDIFDFNNQKFINFLMNCFPMINSKFHYLAYIDQEVVEEEILKASVILGILPTTNDRKPKRFKSLSEDEKHKFWLCFFHHFEVRCMADSTLHTGEDSLLSSLAEFKTYMKDDFQIASFKKHTLMDSELKQEVKLWLCTEKCDLSRSYIDELEIIEDDVFNENVDIKLLVKNIEYLEAKLTKLQLNSSPESYEQLNCFDEFNNYVETFEEYIFNCQAVEKFRGICNSAIVDADSESDKGIMNQLVRCSKLVKKLICKPNSQ